jgi:predicted flap endonuclease-1-like 5' DNA nuclease|tara:strand:- start:13816 stop:14205 length:390 start_codon:yes stop_codon:yes gene_type:complete
MAKNIRAKFFEEQRETTKVALVEISIIGDPSTVVLKVTEEHKEQFPDEWKAFAGGKDDVVTDGTPLTDVKGIGPKLASKLKVNGIHTAEQLAAVNDGGLEAVGMSAYTHRQSARELLNLVPDSVGSIAP